LGTGGLVRAYSAAAKEAIAKAQVLQMCDCTLLSVCCDYTYHARLLSLIENSNAEVVDTEFTDKVKVIFRMRSGETDAFRDNLCENFASKLTANVELQEFFPFKIKK
jgi:putative IMPACT (imprinted ancient) family translation regulator